MNNYLPVMLLKDLITLPNQEVKVELSNNLSKKIDLAIIFSYIIFWFVIKIKRIKRLNS